MCKLKFKSWTPMNLSKPASIVASQPVRLNLTGHYWYRSNLSESPGKAGGLLHGIKIHACIARPHGRARIETAFSTSKG